MENLEYLHEMTPADRTFKRNTLHERSAQIRQIIRDIIENATKDYVGSCKMCYRFECVQQTGSRLQCRSCGFVFNVGFHDIGVYASLFHIYLGSRDCTAKGFIHKLHKIFNQDFVLDEEKIMEHYWPRIAEIYGMGDVSPQHNSPN